MARKASGGRAAGRERERSKRGTRVGRLLVMLSLLWGIPRRDAPGGLRTGAWKTGEVPLYPGNDLGRLLR